MGTETFIAPEQWAWPLGWKPIIGDGGSAGIGGTFPDIGGTNEG